jgi:two-component system, chemotaxis family, chemotaxis protein CheY
MIEMSKRWDLSQVSFLVIEDNMHMRSILRSVLSGFGVRQIYEAADGADGLETVVDRTPDMVLVDWAMHPIGGADFIKILRADKDRIVNTTPVVVVSAHSRKATILEAMKLGIHGFIAKPVSPVILYDRIGDILQKQSLNGRCKGVFGFSSNERQGGCAKRDTVNRAEATAPAQTDPAMMALL